VGQEFSTREAAFRNSEFFNKFLGKSKRSELPAGWMPSRAFLQEWLVLVGKHKPIAVWRLAMANNSQPRNHLAFSVLLRFSH
jgi:hypothetical protein